MSEDGWVRYKSRHVGEHTLRGIDRWAVHPCATALGRPLAGLPVVVVGAGPSLAKNGHLLSELAKHAVIFAVNASAAPCESYGVTPDVLVARESVDVSAQIAASKAGSVVLDIGCHVSCWDAAGDRALWFVPGYPRHFHLCAALGARPLFAGTSALNAAVALAWHWGSRDIALIGTDLALGPAGETYHPAAPRGRSRAIVGSTTVLFENDEADQELVRASGQVPHSREISVLRVPGYYGGEVATISTHLDQLEWLSLMASQWVPQGTALLNATEGGAAVPGWEPIEAAKLPGLWWEFDRPVRPLPLEADARAVNVNAARALLRDEAANLATVADEILSDDPSWATLAETDLVNGASFCDVLSAAARLDMRLRTVPGQKRLRALYEVHKEAAERALELLGEER